VPPATPSWSSRGGGRAPPTGLSRDDESVREWPGDAGVLQGDLILYGRGDPTWSARCYGVDTLARACALELHGHRRDRDSSGKGSDASGQARGDGSYFEPP